MKSSGSMTGAKSRKLQSETLDQSYDPIVHEHELREDLGARARVR
jgi:hypothetical protein